MTDQPGEHREHVDVVVVGGGPAGVAAAIALRRAGITRVVLLEREAYLGGATRHCGHSPFGMLEFRRIFFGASYGRRLEKEAARFGVDVRLGHSVVRLHDDGSVQFTSASVIGTLVALRVLVATGARETTRAARLLPGDRPVGVVTTGTLQSYVAFYGTLPFRRPLIIGSELVSLSALLTCITHGARPVAMVEQRGHALAWGPLMWLPRLLRIPVFFGADILDIQGDARVSKVRVRSNGREQILDCDGVLLTGRFTPEATLYRRATFDIDGGSDGPAVDQNGRLANPRYYSAGNVLRSVETAGWSFREGRAVGKAIARDLLHPDETSPYVPVEIDNAIKLVVPAMIRRVPVEGAALGTFQLRFQDRSRGVLSLVIDGKTVWQARKHWKPERRILVPIPAAAIAARSIRFEFQERA